MAELLSQRGSSYLDRSLRQRPYWRPIPASLPHKYPSQLQFRHFIERLEGTSEAAMGPLVLVSQLATGLGVLASAAVVKSAMEGWRPMARGGWPRCETCNGTGRVACLCSRWSDGDAGCRSCAGSGKVACRSCGGSGTARPLPVRVSMRSGRTP